MTKINICGRLTCHGHSPGGQVTPPTILPWAVVFFFASTGIVPQGYFTGKKKKKRVTSVISLHWIHSKPSQTDSYEHLQWSFLSWKTGSWCGSMGSQKSPKAAQQACSFFLSANSQIWFHINIFIYRHHVFCYVSKFASVWVIFNSSKLHLSVRGPSIAWACMWRLATIESWANLLLSHSAEETTVFCIHPSHNRRKEPVAGILECQLCCNWTHHPSRPAVILQ